MRVKEETPIEVTEYLRDAMRHIEEVTGSVKKAIGGIRTTRGLEPTELKFFGRGCSVKADRLPPPFGGGCDEPPVSVGDRRAKRSAGRRRGR